MASEKIILDRVRQAANKKILFLPHAVRQMSRTDRMISTVEVRRIVTRTGKLVEDYPEDQRGHSCLVLGFGKGRRTIHVVCSPKDEYLAIITAYIPDPNQWDSKFEKRRK